MIPMTPKGTLTFVNFIPLGRTRAITTSRDFWQVWDNFEKMTENYNGKGLYWNYKYQVWKTFAISPCNQAVAFSDVASSITSRRGGSEAIAIAANVSMMILTQWGL